MISKFFLWLFTSPKKRWRRRRPFTVHWLLPLRYDLLKSIWTYHELSEVVEVQGASSDRLAKEMLKLLDVCQGMNEKSIFSHHFLSQSFSMMYWSGWWKTEFSYGGQASKSSKLVNNLSKNNFPRTLVSHKMMWFGSYEKRTTSRGHVQGQKAKHVQKVVCAGVHFCGLKRG